MRENSKVLKIVMGGDGGIGKTTMLSVFCENSYYDHDITIALDIHVKKVEVNGSIEVLQIWDLSGQEQFRFLLSSFFQDVHGIILGFDMSRYQSFRNLKNWITLFREKNDKTPILLMATKADKGYHPMLNSTMALEFQQEQQLAEYIEVSAKEKKNVDLLFQRLIETIHGFIPGTVEIKFLDSVRETISEEKR